MNESIDESMNESINESIKDSMKKKDNIRLDSLRAIKSAILIEKTKSGSKEQIEESVILKILQKKLTCLEGTVLLEITLSLKAQDPGIMNSNLWDLIIGSLNFKQH